eukprot:862760_1
MATILFSLMVSILAQNAIAETITPGSSPWLDTTCPTDGSCTTCSYRIDYNRDEGKKRCEGDCDAFWSVKSGTPYEKECSAVKHHQTTVWGVRYYWWRCECCYAPDCEGYDSSINYGVDSPYKYAMSEKTNEDEQSGAIAMIMMDDMLNLEQKQYELSQTILVTCVFFGFCIAV